MARRGILCGGSWCVDRNKLIDHWPEQETIAGIVAEERQGGGNGANASVDLRRLEAPFPVEAVGVVGNDLDGRFLLELCREMGIDARQMHLTDKVATAYTDVMTVKATGKRTFFYCPGSHDLCSPDHFDFSLTGAAILHLGLPGTLAAMDAPWQGEPSGWVATLKKARAAGLRTNLELCPVADSVNRDLTRPCLPHLDFLIINDAEAGAVAGIPTVNGATTDVAACERAAWAIRETSTAGLIVVHFPLGSVAVTRAGSVVRQPSVKVPQAAIKGSNGAGDAFAAGMLFGIHEEWPLDECLKLASATAAASLRSVTTNGAVESWQACLRLAAAWGWREAPA